MFFVEINNNQEELLYDFSLNPGDTLPHAYNNQYEYAIVFSIDSVLVGNQYRKRFNLEYTETGATEIIEGIGSNAGLLEPLFQFEDNYRLGCFNFYDSVYYPDYSSLCDLISGFKELRINNKSLEIFPNPANRQVTIFCKDGTTIEEVIIYNITGQIVHQEKPVNNIIDISELQPGMYIIEVISGERKIRKKLMIVKEG